jgi:hypothetical protein
LKRRGEFNAARARETLFRQIGTTESATCRSGVSSGRGRMNLDEKSVSVAIEDVEPENWTREVYKPHILNNPKIYKKPGYEE